MTFLKHVLRSSPVSKTWFNFFSLYKQIWLLSYIIRFPGSKFKWLHYFMVNISVLMIVKQSLLMKTPCFITFPCSTILRPPTNHSNVKKLKTMLSYGWKCLKNWILWIKVTLQWHLWGFTFIGWHFFVNFLGRKV